MFGRLRAALGLGTLSTKGALPKRETFRLKAEHVARIELASRPNAHPTIVQSRANAAWGDIARDLGVDYRSIRPVDESDTSRITAVPLPNDKRNGGIIVLPEYFEP